MKKGKKAEVDQGNPNRDRIPDEVAAIKARHGLTDAQWDAIADHPPNHSDYWAGVRWEKESKPF